MPATPNLRPAAASAFLDAVLNHNDDARTIIAALPTRPTLAQSRSAYRRLARVEASFAREVRAITFPADLGPDVKALLQASGAYEASLNDVGDSTSLSRAGTRARVARQRAQVANSAAERLGNRLGLPNLPIPG